MKTKYKILIHLIYWFYITYQAIFPVFISSTPPNYEYHLIEHLFGSIVIFYSFYFSFNYLFSRKNKFIAIIEGIVYFIFLIGVRFLIEIIYYNYIFIYTESITDYTNWILGDIRVVIVSFIYALLIRLAIGWFESQRLKIELINQNQISELTLLRSQVNPHFLFNTLNNIYSLVYKKSDDAPAALMKLSSIMRYMLYDANTDSVLLEKELDYLNSFIELQKLRLKHKDFVDLKIIGNIKEKTISPMLLIPFVENAFKHGSKNVQSPGIKITLTVMEKGIEFEVINHIKKGLQINKDKEGGIGLQNIKRRLELLYPGQHNILINKDENIFYVKLIIKTK